MWKKPWFIKSLKTKKLKIGNGLDKGVQLGPMTTKKRLDEIEEMVEITKKEGANVLCGGKRPSGVNKGYFCDGKKINKKQVYDLNGRIVIGLLHNGKKCKKDGEDYCAIHLKKQINICENYKLKVQ